MVIKKQPVISWLLEPSFAFHTNIITVQHSDYLEDIQYNCNGLNFLNNIRKAQPDWGLPELLMPSFEKAMKKSAKSFYSIDHQLFQEFRREEVCGILIHLDHGTIVYGFGENNNSEPTLYIWQFKTVDGVSILYNYFSIVSTENNHRQTFRNPHWIDNPYLFTNNSISREKRNEIYSCIGNLIISYLAIKKYAEVETVVVPTQSVTIIDDSINGINTKEKIKNDSGQKVVVMDSRWFVKIVNDNDIPVRGHFQRYRTKNDLGEWHWVLRYKEPHNRRGYHRNALVEEK